MKSSDSAVKENAKAVLREQVILGIIALLSVLVSVVTGTLIVRVLMRQLAGEPAQAPAAAIAAGDLASPVMLRHGDTGSLLASLDGMQANLCGLFSQIKDASVSVALAADKIS